MFRGYFDDCAFISSYEPLSPPLNATVLLTACDLSPDWQASTGQHLVQRTPFLASSATPSIHRHQLLTTGPDMLLRYRLYLGVFERGRGRPGVDSFRREIAEESTIHDLTPSRLKRL